MTRRCILAIDQGTTSTKAVLVDGSGMQLAHAACAVGIRFPRPGWVEQDASDIWGSVLKATEQCLEAAGDIEVVGIGICNQRESALAWDRRTGAAIAPCITWQCRRTSEFCEHLARDRESASWIERTTGLTIDPLFSGSKFRWLLDNLPHGSARAAAGEICLGTVDSWLLWNLTNRRVHATDMSNASRTQLLDIEQGKWSLRLLDIFGVPSAALPDVRATDAPFGEAIHPDWPCRAPILGVAGDSHAAMFAHAAVAPDVVKATIGTGSSLMALTPVAIPSAGTGLSSTVAWNIAQRTTYAMEGNIASAGATLDWIGRLFGYVDDPGSAAIQLATAASDSGGVIIVPAFTGLGAPHWDDQSRGLICGITRGSGAPQFARAALESIAQQVTDVFETMELAVQRPLVQLHVDGGVTRSDALLQFQADLLGKPVVRDNALDLSALGIALVAGLGAQLWTLADLCELPRAVDRFLPTRTSSDVSGLRDSWRTAIARTKLRVPAKEQRS